MVLLRFLIAVLLVPFTLSRAQMATQVKITDRPYQVSNAQQLNQIVWTVIGNNIKENVFCVSEAPVSQLRFVCLDCEQKNITDMVSALNYAQDQTRLSGFPAVELKLSSVNTNWTGATIVCQAALNGGTIDSSPATVDIRFLRQPHVVDGTGQAPVQIQNQGNRFYVECQRGPDGLCQPSGRRKTLRCSVQSHPPASTFRWLNNGVPTSGNGAEITVGTEMIGHSIQCSANNGLYNDNEMPTSQAVQIDPYSAARLVSDNFNALQNAAPFQAGNRIEVNKELNLACVIEGNPRPVAFWKMRKPNGEITDAPCPQGFDGQYQEIQQDPLRNPLASANIVRYNALCTLRISNYSYTGQYWCSACSYVSQGDPECSPSLEAPGTSTLNVQVQGPPMPSDVPTTIDQQPNSNNAIVTVHYCAQPAPVPPRDILFTIDQNDIQVGQRWENFRFESQAQNNTSPNCFLARLQIAPVREEDQYRQISLRVVNQYGTRLFPVSLESLLGGGSSLSARLSPWWIAFFVLLGIFVALACLTAICVKRRMFCFNQVKKGSEYSETKAKANLNVRSTLYNDDVNPRLYQQNAEKTRGSYHEGLNYAEMRLSDRTPVVSAALPMAVESLPVVASPASGVPGDTRPLVTTTTTTRAEHHQASSQHVHFSTTNSVVPPPTPSVNSVV